MTLVILCGSCGGKVNGPHGSLYEICECDDPDIFNRPESRNNRSVDTDTDREGSP